MTLAPGWVDFTRCCPSERARDWLSIQNPTGAGDRSLATFDQVNGPVAGGALAQVGEDLVDAKSSVLNFAASKAASRRSNGLAMSATGAGTTSAGGNSRCRWQATW